MTLPRDPRPASGAPIARRGFTIVELSVAIVIVVLLVSLAVGAAARAFRGARVAGEQQVCNNLKIAVEQFKQLHGFLPPLLRDDADPVVGPVDSNKEPIAWAEPADLQVDPSNKPRFSVCSLAYYIVGAPDHETDGVDGPGYKQPLRGGKFSKQGKRFESLFDVTKDRSRLVRAGIPGEVRNATRITIVDRWHPVGDNGWPTDGPAHAIRFYRWEPTFYPQADAANRGTVKDYNVPRFLGDPEKAPALKTARFAIVSAGPNGELIDDPADLRAVPDSPENRDNIVEFGS